MKTETEWEDAINSMFNKTALETKTSLQVLNAIRFQRLRISRTHCQNGFQLFCKDDKITKAQEFYNKTLKIVVKFKKFLENQENTKDTFGRNHLPYLQILERVHLGILDPLKVSIDRLQELSNSLGKSDRVKSCLLCLPGSKLLGLLTGTADIFAKRQVEMDKKVPGKAARDYIMNERYEDNITLLAKNLELLNETIEYIEEQAKFGRLVERLIPILSYKEEKNVDLSILVSNNKSIEKFENGLVHILKSLETIQSLILLRRKSMHLVKSTINWEKDEPSNELIKKFTNLIINDPLQNLHILLESEKCLGDGFILILKTVIGHTVPSHGYQGFGNCRSSLYNGKQFIFCMLKTKEDCTISPLQKNVSSCLLNSNETFSCNRPAIQRGLDTKRTEWNSMNFTFTKIWESINNVDDKNYKVIYETFEDYIKTYFNRDGDRIMYLMEKREEIMRMLNWLLWCRTQSYYPHWFKNDEQERELREALADIDEELASIKYNFDLFMMFSKDPVMQQKYGLNFTWSWIETWFRTQQTQVVSDGYVDNDGRYGSGGGGGSGGGRSNGWGSGGGRGGGGGRIYVLKQLGIVQKCEYKKTETKHITFRIPYLIHLKKSVTRTGYFLDGSTFAIFKPGSQ